MLLLNHFAEVDYHSYFWTSHCLNLVEIFLFHTKWPTGFLKVCVFSNSFPVDQPNVGFSKTDAIIKCHTCSSDLFLKFCKNIQPIVHNHSLKTCENFWTNCITSAISFIIAMLVKKLKKSVSTTNYNKCFLFIFSETDVY